MSDRRAALVFVLVHGGRERGLRTSRAEDHRPVLQRPEGERPTDHHQLLHGGTSTRRSTTGRSPAPRPETRSPAMLADLAKKVGEVEAELAANKKAAGAYSLEHYADIEKVKDAQKAGKPVPGGLTGDRRRLDQVQRQGPRPEEAGLRGQGGRRAGEAQRHPLRGPAGQRREADRGDGREAARPRPHDRRRGRSPTR